MDCEAKFVKVGEVAAKLGFCRTTIIRWILSGRVRGGRTPAGHYAIPIDEFRRLSAEMAGKRLRRPRRRGSRGRRGDQ